VLNEIRIFFSFINLIRLKRFESELKRERERERERGGGGGEVSIRSSGTVITVPWKVENLILIILKRQLKLELDF